MPTGESIAIFARIFDYEKEKGRELRGEGAEGGYFTIDWKELGTGVEKSISFLVMG